MTEPIDRRIRLLVRDLMEMAPDPPDVRIGQPAGASPARRRSIPPWPTVIAAAVVAAVAVGLPLLLLGNGEDTRGRATTTTGGWQLTESQEKAAAVGIVEQPPAEGGSGYLPAPVPYLGVGFLSNYSGLDAAVVPETAVVTRDGIDVVFVVVSELLYSERYIRVEVEARPVAPRERIGRALVVEEGLTGCDIVIVAPPETLKDGDVVRSFAEERAEDALEVDYQRLFQGIDPAGFDLSGGFLRPGASAASVFVIVNQREDVEIPPGSTLIFQPPNGPERRFNLTGGFPQAHGLEFEMLTEELVRGERVGSVRVISPSGAVIASGKLDWWCP
jgi:hypothetical protein